MKKMIVFIMLLGLVLTASSVQAYEENSCQYWYSSSTHVGHWFSTPKVAKEKLNNSMLFEFSQAISHSRIQWNSVQVPTSSCNSIENADIPCIGGTASEIYAAYNYSINPNAYNGMTVVSKSFYCQITYQNQQKSLYAMNHATVYILDKGYTNPDKYKATSLHELGHALGWCGHSSLSSDAMYEYSNLVLTPTLRDERQIHQFY